MSGNKFVEDCRIYHGNHAQDERPPQCQGPFGDYKRYKRA